MLVEYCLTGNKIDKCDNQTLDQLFPLIIIIIF